jgi:hypothetical protein
MDVIEIKYQALLKRMKESVLDFETASAIHKTYLLEIKRAIYLEERMYKLCGRVVIGMLDTCLQFAQGQTGSDRANVPSYTYLTIEIHEGCSLFVSNIIRHSV